MVYPSPISASWDKYIPTYVVSREHCAFLSVSAGINEELFYRALLPVLFLGILDNQAIAIALSVLVFGFAHAYQGCKGVLATAAVGWLWMRLFILSNNIFVPMFMHALIDLNSLVLMPSLHGTVNK